MKEVRIAELKSRLSEYLRAVRTGVVYAPAADVRAMMRLLVLDAGQTVQ